MRDHVIVVPNDNIIIVDGMVLRFDYEKPENVHAIQWHNGKGHIEFTDDSPNTDVEDYDSQVAPFVTLWQVEKDRLDAEVAAAEAEFNRLENVKARKLAAIDSETSSAILAGFTCEATPTDTGKSELLYFSYDEFDQQNFADAAMAMQLASVSDGSIPTSTPWNAYRNHTAENKGELVILNLTAETFVPIYAAAMQHKAINMAEGGRRKAAVAAAQTKEEVESI